MGLCGNLSRGKFHKKKIQAAEKLLEERANESH